MRECVKMIKRRVVEIDDEKCSGCGKCIPRCHEGALQIIDGKARLVSDRYCDGLGDCLGTCPMDAIRIVERDAEPFDEEAVARRQRRPSHSACQSAPAGCPGAAVIEFAKGEAPSSAAESAEKNVGSTPGALSQWPVQLSLVPVNAPYFNGADILLAADCVPFAYADFHSALLAGRKVLIGCPKLDDGEFYSDKLAEILKNNDIRSLTVAHMEVPCCHALLSIARSALQKAGSDLDICVKVVSIGGEVRS